MGYDWNPSLDELKTNQGAAAAHFTWPAITVIQPLAPEGAGGRKTDGWLMVDDGDGRQVLMVN